MNSCSKLNEINDTEFLKRLIIFYEQALLFYSKKTHYQKTIESNLPLIIIDGGSQANYALETVKNLLKEHESIIDEYNDYESRIEENIKGITKK